MATCGFCPVTPEDFEKVPPTDNGARDTTNFMTFPCGHAFHTQCVMEYLCKLTYCQYNYTDGMNSCQCTLCETHLFSPDKMRFYQNYYNQNFQTMRNEDSKKQQAKVAEVYQENEEFRNNVDKYNDTVKEHNKYKKEYTAHLKTVKDEFKETIKPSLEAIRVQQALSLQRLRSHPSYLPYRKSLHRMRFLDQQLRLATDASTRHIEKAMEKIDGAPKLKISNLAHRRQNYDAKYIFQVFVV
jgi:hypothetical protein